MITAAILNAFLSLIFSFGYGQTAQMNVLAIPTPAASPSITAPPALAVAGICDITLTFFDGQSNQLKTKEVSINPGSSTSLSMSWPVAQKLSKAKPLFYGQVQLLADSDPSCQISGSLEITQTLDGSVESLVPMQLGPNFLGILIHHYQ